MSNIKKYVAEAIGTMTLVLIGCGTAMLTGCEHWAGYLATAFAFGLTIVGMAYCVGNISGCHINPAVSLAVFMNGGMTGAEFAGYAVSQCIGSALGSVLLLLIFGFGNVEDETGGFGANGLAGVNDNVIAGLLVEIVLTILGVTSKKANHGSFGGVVIGFTLVLVHLLGIGLTGTSVNPARSLFPAIFALAAEQNSTPLAQLWVFIVGPFAGAALAAVTHKFLEKEN